MPEQSESKNRQEGPKKRSIRLAGKITVGFAGGLAANAATLGVATAIGTASTGTAISSLSGIAASKAALAWLGGGALAAGGGGIAVGGIVLAGTTYLGYRGARAIYKRAIDKKVTAP